MGVYLKLGITYHAGRIGRRCRPRHRRADRCRRRGRVGIHSGRIRRSSMRRTLGSYCCQGRYRKGADSEESIWAALWTFSTTQIYIIVNCKRYVLFALTETVWQNVFTMVIMERRSCRMLSTWQIVKGQYWLCGYDSIHLWLRGRLRKLTSWFLILF